MRQSYSKPKVGRFLRHGVYLCTIPPVRCCYLPKITLFCKKRQIVVYSSFLAYVYVFVLMQAKFLTINLTIMTTMTIMVTIKIRQPWQQLRAKYGQCYNNNFSFSSLSTFHRDSVRKLHCCTCILLRVSIHNTSKTLSIFPYYLRHFTCPIEFR